MKTTKKLKRQEIARKIRSLIKEIDDLFGLELSWINLDELEVITNYLNIIMKLKNGKS